MIKPRIRGEVRWGEVEIHPVYHTAPHTHVHTLIHPLGSLTAVRPQLIESREPVEKPRVH